jgi:hypothetical protein
MWFSREREARNKQASNDPIWDYPEPRAWDGSWVGIMCNEEQQARNIKEAFYVDLRYTFFFTPMSTLAGRRFHRLILFRPAYHLSGTDAFDQWQREMLLTRLTPNGKKFFVD